MQKQDEGRIMRTLQHLAKHGWITLRALSILLGYKNSTGIYARQRGKNPIPVIKVDSTYRVYADAVINTLQNVPEEDQVAAQTFLKLYYAALKEKDNG
jgi:hypothetical protein